MPAVEVDVRNIPDIIEAQLTLSYHRLSDLIRVIVEQGNAHDEELGLLRQRIDALEGQNRALRNELTATRKEKNKSDTDTLMANIAELQRELARLQEKMDVDRQINEATAKSHDQKIKEVEEQAESKRLLLEDRVNRTDHSLSALKSSHDLLKAFYDLWGAEDIQVMNMSARVEGDSAFENDIETRTQFVHSLPAFADVRDEVDALRTLLQRSTADSMAGKGAEESHASEVSGESGQLLERVQRLEALLKDLGLESSDGLSLAQRLALLEETVDGAVQNGVGDGARTGSAASAPSGAGLQQPRPPPLFVGDYLTKSSRSSSGRTGSSQQQGGARPAGRNSLPPINAPAAGAGSAAAGGGAGGPAAAASNDGSTNNSLMYSGYAGSTRPGISVLTVEQPHVDLLRSEASADMDGSGSAAAAGVPKVNILYPEEGLRRRVEQMEEDIAMLELKKADRSEVSILEEALRQLLIQTAASRGPNEQQDAGRQYHPPGATVNPGRPLFVNTGGAVNLRDGVRTTNATISPVGFTTSPPRGGGR